jgi:hypothetical protein
MPDKESPPWVCTALHLGMYKKWGLSFGLSAYVYSGHLIYEDSALSWYILKDGEHIMNHNLVCWFLEKYPEIQEKYKANESGYMYFDILAAAELEVLGESDYNVEPHLLKLIEQRANA